MIEKTIYITCLALLCGCAQETADKPDPGDTPRSSTTLWEVLESKRAIALDSFGEAGENVRSFAELADSLDTIPPNMGYLEWPESGGGPHFEFNYNSPSEKGEDHPE